MCILVTLPVPLKLMFISLIDLFSHLLVLFTLYVPLFLYLPFPPLPLLCQSTNSTRYQHLIDKLFSGDAPQLRPWSFYQEPADNKRDRPKRVRICVLTQVLVVLQT